MVFAFERAEVRPLTSIDSSRSFAFDESNKGRVVVNDSDAKRARPRLARLKDQREGEELFLKGLARGNGLSVSIIPARTVQDERVGGVRS